MEFLFGRQKTPQELLRENQRALNKAIRELDRERMRMELHEKRVIGDIKRLARSGKMDAVRVLAKDLIQTRKFSQKFVLMRANIQAVSLRLTAFKSSDTMTQAMQGVVRAMATMNQQLKLPQLQSIMMEFARESQMMDMRAEMMNDAIDDAVGDDSDEEESDAIVRQVMDELGLQISGDLAALPTAGQGSVTPAAGARQPTAMVADDAGLEERLINLRRQ